MLVNSKANTFIEEIEDLCISKNIEYIDAVVCWCEKHNLEIEYAADLIKTNPVLKSKIQTEAENLNFIKRIKRLPI
jgi:hypothetical protein